MEFNIKGTFKITDDYVEFEFERGDDKYCSKRKRIREDNLSKILEQNMYIAYFSDVVRLDLYNQLVAEGFDEDAAVLKKVIDVPGAFAEFIKDVPF